MKIKLILLFCCIIFCSIRLLAQDYLGYNTSNYQTVGGMIFNPASIAGSPYQVSVNILSVNVGATNNAYKFKKNLFSGDWDEGSDFFKVNKGGTKDMYIHTDVLAPSFMIDLGPKIGAIGFSSRVRVLASENNLDNSILQLFGDKNPTFFGKRHVQNDLLVDIHGFADLGLTYGRTLWANKSHVIKGGATLKYVIGIAGASFRADNLAVELDIDNLITEQELVKELKGDVSFLYSSGIDVAFGSDSDLGDILDAATSSSGFGFDVGFEYEWYKDGNYQPVIDNRSVWKTNILTPYTLKISLSLTDIGSVKYNPSENAANYRVNIDESDRVTSDILNLDDDNLNDYIERLKSQGYLIDAGGDGKYKMSLPAMLRLNVDYNAYKQLFVNAGTSINMLGKKKHGARYASYYYITPRYESNWIGVYSPFSFNSLGQFRWGLGVNLGPFFIGSSSFLSNLFSSRIQGADVHLGFTVPIRHKIKEIKGDGSPPEIDSSMILE